MSGVCQNVGSFSKLNKNSFHEHQKIFGFETRYKILEAKSYASRFTFHTSIDTFSASSPSCTGLGLGVEDDAEDMVIYVGEGINGVYNTPYFDATMKTNYTVQVVLYLDFHFKGLLFI